MICIDINRQELELELGRKLVAKKFPEVAAKIEFVHPEDFKESETGDLAISFDSFEHVMDPAKVLRDCRSWLRAGGKLWVSSLGWYNYMASHCRWHIPIPWCQVLFSEKAIIRTIQTLIREPDYVPNMWERAEGVGRWDNVTTLKYRPGEPMNMLSLRQVKRLMKQSGFRVEFTVHGFSGRANPLARGLAFLSKVPVLNEIFHSSYSAVLTKAESDRPIGSLSRAA